MRILVAGASGAVGRQLVPRLARAGHRVTGTSRTPRGVATVRAMGVDAAQVDALDPEALRAVVSSVAPDVIVHQLTAFSDFDLAANARVRVEGTRNLVRAARAAGVRRMLVQSSSNVYQPGTGPAEESTPLDLGAAPPRAGTIRAIQAMEDAAATMPEYVVLRYGTLYGPGTWYAPDERMAKRLRAGGLRADASVSSFLHVEDAALAVLAALEWPDGAVNVVDDDPAPAAEWLPALARALGEPPPSPALGRAGWERGASNALARYKLDWVPKYSSWRTGFTALC